MTFGDGSSVIPIFIDVDEVQSQSEGCSIDVFPTVLSNIKVKQGEEKTRTIQLTVPSCFSNNVNVNGVILQSDERPIQLGELNLGSIAPGNSVSIPIEIDALTDVSTGTYSDILLFSVFNITGEKINLPSVSISTTVSSGINPNSDFSLSNLPTCSINSIEMNLNETYKMTCSNIDPNIDVKPIIDSKFINGIGVSESSGQYIYEFKPITIGTTLVGAEFLFKNAPIGSIYEQEIRVSSSGNSPVSGTDIKVEFWQQETKRNVDNLFGGDTTITIVDNKTNSLIQNANLFLNGVEINGTVNLLVGREYELRVDAFGYVGNVINFNVSESTIEYTITPSGVLTTDTNINISVNNAVNASIFIDGVKYEREFLGTLTAGDHELEFIHKEFQNLKVNLTVENSVFISGYNPDTFEKNAIQIFTINKNVSWTIKHQENANSQPNLEFSGVGDKIEFTPDKKGTWLIEAEDKVLGSYEIKGWAPLQWFKDNWIYTGIILIVLMIVGYFLFIKDGDGGKDPQMQFQMGGGGTPEQ